MTYGRGGSTPYRLPGNPDDVEKGAGALSDTAERIRECATTLEALANGEGGKSKGLEKAIEKAREMHPRLSQAAERYEVAGDALAEFAVDQRAAIEAADAAIARYEQASEDLGGYPQGVGRGGEPLDEAEQAARDDLLDEKQAALEAWRRAKDDLDEAGDRADRRIEDIVKDSKLNDGRFDDLKGALEDVAGFLGDVAEVVGELLASLAGLAKILAPLLLPPPAGWALLAYNLTKDHPGDVSDDVQRDAIERWYQNKGGYQDHVKLLRDLAADAYKSPSKPPEPWEALSEGALRAHGITMTDDDGFSATVYRNPETGEIVVAYRGTEPTADPYNDITEDIIGGSGQESSQGQQAVDLATQVTEAFGTENVEFTGHSLGGGLAAAASVATGAEATTFNAAGVGEGNYNYAADAYGSGASADNVVNFNTDNDPLTNVQNLSGNTPPAGAQIDIESSSSDWQVWGGHGVGQFDWDETENQGRS